MKIPENTAGGAGALRISSASPAHFCQYMGDTVSPRRKP